jgi:hypothetical protein
VNRNREVYRKGRDTRIRGSKPSGLNVSTLIVQLNARYPYATLAQRGEYSTFSSHAKKSSNLWKYTSVTAVFASGYGRGFRK